MSAPAETTHSDHSRRERPLSAACEGDRRIDEPGPYPPVGPDQCCGRHSQKQAFSQS